MKRVYITAALTALAVLLVHSLYHPFWNKYDEAETLKVGFMYEGDGSTPDTYNFAMAEDAVKLQFADRVETLSLNNVLPDEAEEPLRDMVARGCGIIFTNVFSSKVARVAEDYPEVQFCQVSGVRNSFKLPDNYHTFNGEIYQGRYISGIAAGLKLKDMFDEHTIQRNEAVVGFVGTFPTPEVISGYTAFLLGVRSVMPTATMRVRYTNSLNSYSLEKAAAKALIDEGCLVIAQHTHTIGPAVACEESKQRVYHIGYNQSMIDVAPTTSIISIRVNWVPYVVGAVEAVMNHRDIERYVDGNAHGENDMSAGIERDWVQILELNQHIAAYDTRRRLDKAIEDFKNGRIEVFTGDYIGYDPNIEDETYDLSKGFAENRDSSTPSFRYILRDVIIED